MKAAAAGAVALAVLLAVALLAPQWLVFMAMLVLAKGVVVLGLLVLMRCGLVSFGQGLYFGIGAYAAALMSHHLHIADAAVMLAAGAVAAGLIAALLGLLLAKYREIFFAMLSLAVSMILYGLLVKSAALGSTDGFNLHARSFFGVALAAGSERRVFLVAGAVWRSSRRCSSIACSPATGDGCRPRCATTSCACPIWAPRPIASCM